MSVFLLRRLATFAATLLAASAVVFAVLEILPGNVAQTMMGPDAPPEAVQALAVQLGLDRPPLERYLGWLHGLLVGELGESHAYGSPVAGLIAERLQVTVRWRCGDDAEALLRARVTPLAPRDSGVAGSRSCPATSRRR